MGRWDHRPTKHSAGSRIRKGLSRPASWMRRRSMPSGCDEQVCTLPCSHTLGPLSDTCRHRKEISMYYSLHSGWVPAFWLFCLGLLVVFPRSDAATLTDGEAYEPCRGPGTVSDVDVIVEFLEQSPWMV